MVQGAKRRDRAGYDGHGVDLVMIMVLLLPLVSLFEMRYSVARSEMTEQWQDDVESIG